MEISNLVIQQKTDDDQVITISNESTILDNTNTHERIVASLGLNDTRVTKETADNNICATMSISETQLNEQKEDNSLVLEQPHTVKIALCETNYTRQERKMENFGIQMECTTHLSNNNTLPLIENRQEMQKPSTVNSEKIQSGNGLFAHSNRQIKSDMYQCILCNAQITKHNLGSHINNAVHKSKSLCIESMDKDEAKEQNDVWFCCEVCNVIIQGESNLIEHFSLNGHVCNVHHTINSITEIDIQKPENLSDEKRILSNSRIKNTDMIYLLCSIILLENDTVCSQIVEQPYIYIINSRCSSVHKHFCLLCRDTIVEKEKWFSNHLEESTHKQQFLELCSQKKTLPIHEVEERLMNIQCIFAEETILNVPIDPRSQSKVVQEVQDLMKIYCDKDQVEDKSDLSDSRCTMVSDKYMCVLCNTQVNKTDMACHIDDPLHIGKLTNTKEKLHSSTELRNRILFSCEFCNFIIHDECTLAEHLTATSHLQNVSRAFHNISQRNIDGCTQILYKEVKINCKSQTNATCVALCNILSTKDNGQIDEQLYLSFIVFPQKKGFRQKYYCNICSVKVSRKPSKLVKHFVKTKHTVNTLKKDYIGSCDSESLDLLGDSASMPVKESAKESTKSLTHTDNIEKPDAVSSPSKLVEQGAKLTKINIVNKSPKSVNPILRQQEMNNNQKRIKRLKANNASEDIAQLIQLTPVFGNKHKRKGGAGKYRFNIKYKKAYLELEEEIYNFDKLLQNIIISCKSAIINLKEETLHCLVCNRNTDITLQNSLEHFQSEQHAANLKMVLDDNDKFSLLQKFLKRISENIATCYSCITFVNWDEKAILNHIQQKKHQETSIKCSTAASSYIELMSKKLLNVWYNIQKYSCAVCETKHDSKLEFVVHVHDNHNQATNASQDYVYDFCLPCMTLWLGYHNTYQIHCNDRTHKYLITKKDFGDRELPSTVKKLLSSHKNIVDQLYKIARELMHDDDMCKKLTTSLEDTLRPVFPTMNIHLFGSRISGLCSRDSDLDIFIDCGDMYYKSMKKGRPNSKILIRNAMAQFLKFNHTWQLLEAIERARIPIIKLWHRTTDLHCDISFTSGLSVEKTQLVRCYNEAYPPCQKLILYLKKWLAVCNLPGPEPISSFALAWCVIFYLQEKGILRSVVNLINQQKSSKDISGWILCAHYNVTAIDHYSNDTITNLLIGFFEYYEKFDYRHYVACPLIGKVVRKNDFVEPESLPTEMRPYIDHVNTSKEPQYFRIDSPMCVQDPYVLSHNLTQAVRTLTLNCFRQYCKESALILKQNL